MTGTLSYRHAWKVMLTALVVVFVVAVTIDARHDRGSVAATGGPLAGLTINDGPGPVVPYDRAGWLRWRDPDGNGCDAREDALTATGENVTHGPGCTVTSGRWRSLYDDYVITDPGALDVDHVVPLAEAHRSGAAGWPVRRRAEFANDPANLLAVSASSNRSKGDRDPARWRPPAEPVWCTYATRWVTVKTTYGLTVDTAERDALAEMLATCPEGDR